jgi:hypothetical protein
MVEKGLWPLEERNLFPTADPLGETAVEEEIL